MRAAAASKAIGVAAALAVVLAACPRSRDDAPAGAATSTAISPPTTGTGTVAIAIPASSTAASAALLASPSPSVDAPRPSFAGLAERVAAIAAAPDRASPLQKQDGAAATTYVVAIPGVRSAAVAVLHGRPDAWSFSIYADGVTPADFGKLKDLAPTPGGGRRWLVVDGPLHGAELFLSPNDASLVVLQSATFRDAAE